MTKYPADVDQPKITKLKEGSTCIVHGAVRFHHFVVLHRKVTSLRRTNCFSLSLEEAWKPPRGKKETLKTVFCRVDELVALLERPAPLTANISANKLTNSKLDRQ